jgi:hypothetical protein
MLHDFAGGQTIDAQSKDYVRGSLGITGTAKCKKHIMHL